jgi:hypothetical protein
VNQRFRTILEIRLAQLHQFLVFPHFLEFLEDRLDQLLLYFRAFLQDLSDQLNLQDR